MTSFIKSHLPDQLVPITSLRIIIATVNASTAPLPFFLVHGPSTINYLILMIYILDTSRWRTGWPHLRAEVRRSREPEAVLLLPIGTLGRRVGAFEEVAAVDLRLVLNL